MASDPTHYRLLSAEEFLQIDFGPDMRAELDQGIIRMMGGGTRDHSRVQSNLNAAVRVALRGSPCRPHGSDMAVRTRENSIRYPDITIDCGATGDQGDDLILSNPRVIVEVLSPSTRSVDLGVKKDEYRAIESVDTIAFVDVEKQALSKLQRIEGGWTEMLFSSEVDLLLPSLGITIFRADIFATD